MKMSDNNSFFYKGLFFVLLIFMFACNLAKDNEVARVNHFPISNDELKFWMLLQRAEVYNYFYEKYGVDDSDVFWKQKINGESPLEMLKNLALKKAVRCKIQQILALNKGVVQQIYFDSIMSKMKVENQRRRTKVENGEVVYGSLKFTNRTFFAYEFDKMLIKLKSELLKEELRPTEKDLRLLANDKDYSLEDNYGFYQMQYVEKNYEKFIDGLVEVAEVEINNKNWNAVDADFN
ncbi:hypothetical protein ACT3CD_01405 [Geofilum sp. OHC36d9]|uniref:hypothetical protein n=1 Tax=Geofilum sp. OHC36d9 TaxID=3458413 RepID=UPI0040337A74